MRHSVPATLRTFPHFGSRGRQTRKQRRPPIEPPPPPPPPPPLAPLPQWLAGQYERGGDGGAPVLCPVEPRLSTQGPSRESSRRKQVPSGSLRVPGSLSA